MAIVVLLLTLHSSLPEYNNLVPWAMMELITKHREAFVQQQCSLAIISTAIEESRTIIYHHLSPTLTLTLRLFKTEI